MVYAWKLTKHTSVNGIYIIILIITRLSSIPSCKTFPTLISSVILRFRTYFRNKTEKNSLRFAIKVTLHYMEICRAHYNSLSPCCAVCARCEHCTKYSATMTRPFWPWLHQRVRSSKKKKRKKKAITPSNLNNNTFSLSPRARPIRHTRSKLKDESGFPSPLPSPSLLPYFPST